MFQSWPGDARFSACLFVAIVLLLVGCAGGGSSYTVDTADLAQRYLPTTRSVDHHPDSLQGFSITESENRYEVSLENSYESLHRKWSCTYLSLGTGPNRRTRSYATFWSKELSMASLEAEVGFSTITKERARGLLEEQLQEYKRTLQIDLYWFESEGSSLVAGPGSRVELEVDGERYRPSRESHGPLRETFLLQGNGRALYRRNTFHFARMVDSTDILKDTEGMSLTINRSGGRVRFTWEWEDEAQSKAHLERQGSFGSRNVSVAPFRSETHRLLSSFPSPDHPFIEHGR